MPNAYATAVQYFSLHCLQKQFSNNYPIVLVKYRSKSGVDPAKYFGGCGGGGSVAANLICTVRSMPGPPSLPGPMPEVSKI